MRYRPLGNTGLMVSELGFGCGAVGGLMTRGEPAEQRAAIARALDAGVTYFDTAQQYGEGRCEKNLGRRLTELGVWDHVVVGTKIRLGRPDFDMRKTRASTTEKRVTELIKLSLQHLERDSVDLIQLHGRVVRAEDADDPTLVEATFRIASALRDAAQQGLARHTGFTGLGDTPDLHAVVNYRGFETVQCYFNAANPSAGFAGVSNGAQDFDGLIDRAAAGGMGVIAIRVLAAGALSGSADRAANASPAGGPPMTPGAEFEADLARARALQAVAEGLGIESTTELALRFALAKESVSTALIGFSNLDQLEQALTWVERGPLDDAGVAAVLATSP